ncbi:MAG: nucleoside recognition domain-containing protein, partial [Verrucomicrobiales bacterium]
MLNYIWLAIITAAVLCGALLGRMGGMTEEVFDSSKTAINLAIGLIGVMMLWLGLMRLAERSGLVTIIAWVIRPVMRLLFPDVPEQHPAMAAMIMNMAANMLGLGNAATPLGLKAMQELEKINAHPGTASNAMCTFLAINTSSVTLIPTTVLAMLAANQIANPQAIIPTAILATLCSTATAITAVKFFQRLPWFRLPVGSGAGNAGAAKRTDSTDPEAGDDGEEEENESGDHEARLAAIAKRLKPMTPGRWAALAAIWLTLLAALVMDFKPAWRESIMQNTGVAAALEAEESRKAEIAEAKKAAGDREEEE